MAVKVTRCPHCQTSFRIREEQLATARGMVRCGSCLQVFRAADYFQIDSIGANTASVQKPSENKPILREATKPTEKTEPIAKTVAAKATTVKAASTNKQNNDDDFGLIHDDMEEDDSSKILADDPSVDFNLRTPEASTRPKKNSALEIDTSIFDSSQTTSFFFDYEKDADTPHASSNEAWAAALLDDSEEEDKSSKLKSDSIAASMLTAEREVDDFTGFIGDDVDDPIDLDDLAIRPNLAINIPKTPTRNVDNLQAEPLSFGATAARNIPWGWLGGILMLLLVAALQVLYFNFDSWARSPQWRPFYTQACTYLDCSLPKVQNINNMSTQHLVVQTHPKLKGALMVDTLLYNKAEYLQPFPDLLLVFRDINERVLASRRFTPRQYLSGELAGQSDMSPKSHTHIALEVVDPGPEAVSYHIDLVANH